MPFQEGRTVISVRRVEMQDGLPLLWLPVS
jgi:hypothetical protein